jgi:hypothetical protein
VTQITIFVRAQLISNSDDDHPPFPAIRLVGRSNLSGLV